MTQEKMRKVIAACVSAATVLLVLLLSYLTYQWITIAVKNKRIAELESDIAYWEQMVKEADTDLEYYQSDFYLTQAVLELQMLQEKK